MKKNQKGFTLIELLAVIVILALIMMIAIPSVTRYITQSRVKTVTKTMDSYITAVVQEVNDGDYHFSDSTKVYAIPIECVSLEKGGTNPFGEWMQANDNYWAYVLVQYDNVNYNYKYGFTFKDSAGYGMYPTVSANIDENSNQVKTGYDDLTKPESGKAVEFVPSDKWNGFDITSDTELIVLEATSEGQKGNGQTTCTLCQKGDNYEQVEEEKLANRKACNLIEGASVALGSRIECGGEYFHVISVTGNSVKMFADEAINSNTGKQRVDGESYSSMEKPYLATSTYWLSGSSLKTKYGTSYPAYVYDSNSSSYPLINTYKTYLLETVGLKDAELSLIDIKDLINLGCSISSNTCNSAPSWVRYEHSGYITGSVTNDKKVYFVMAGALTYFNYNSVGSSPRPVVVISLDEIKK